MAKTEPTSGMKCQMKKKWLVQRRPSAVGQISAQSVKLNCASKDLFCFILFYENATIFLAAVVISIHLSYCSGPSFKSQSLASNFGTPNFSRQIYSSCFGYIQLLKLKIDTLKVFLKDFICLNVGGKQSFPSKLTAAFG